LKPGDQFLLASDGLEIVDERLVRETLGGNAAAQAVQCLIELALHNKAPDNVTAVVVEAIPDGRG
jgi:serine/threonine protein phosphatase PrpC